MIGWCDEWHVNRNTADKGLDYCELLTNMAGNAYSLWHFGPWFLSLVATYGMFAGKECADDVEGACAENDDPSSQGSSSISSD